MRSLTKTTLSATLLSTTLLGCGQGDLSQDADAGYAAFRAAVHQEPDSGVFIVDGDTPIVGEPALREFFDGLQRARQGAEVGARPQGLIVHRSGGADARWSEAEKGDLRYCVSTAFGARYDAVKASMTAATGEWSLATGAAVRFVHDTTQDATCTAANSNVVFDVRPVSGQPYLARGFSPDMARAQRSVLVDSASFSAGLPWSLSGILRHELGHTIGFRHEHTRPEAGICFEDNSWRALTSYDAASVMHYPHCNGRNSGDFVLTAQDKAGAAVLYTTVYASTLAEVEGRSVRVTNSFLGARRALDSGAAAPNTPFMSPRGASWRLTSLGGGWYRLTNATLGEGRALDTYSNGANAPFMGTTGGYSGQYWHVTAYGDRCFRLTNSFLGEGRSLDTYSNGTNAPFMGTTGDYSGQCWRLQVQ